MYRTLCLFRNAALVLCTMSISSASAADLFGYTPNANPANPATFNNSNPRDFIASRFTVGASPLTVNTMSYYAGGNGTVTSSIAIWSAKTGSLDGFEPDTLVAGATANFTPNDTTSPWSIFTVNFAGDVTLSANTNYYVVVDTSGVTNTAALGYVATTSGTSDFTAFGGTDATPQIRLVASADGGSSWSSFSGLSFLPYTVGFTAVPEPSTYLLGLIGTVSLACVGRRRVRS